MSDGIGTLPASASAPDQAPAGVRAAPGTGHAATHCLDCGTALTGPYCAQCGQRVGDPHPTLREMAHDALGELLQVDGKVARSFRLLLTRPGALTLAYLQGKRSRYVSPVKLYLICSAVFFFVSATIPAERGVDSRGKPRTGLVTTLTRSMTASTFDNGPSFGKSDAERTRATSRLRAAMSRAGRDSLGYQRSVEEALPKAVFFLIPFTAALLALLFRSARLHFPQHLVFTLHLQSVFFLLATVQSLRPVISTHWVARILFVGPMLADVVYLYVASRRVYQRSVPGTVARVMVMTSFYLLMLLATLSICALVIGLSY